MERPHHLSGTGQGELARCALLQLREAEVGHLDATAALQQHVLRLDVTVHDPLLVGVLQGLADLRHDRKRLGRRELARVHELTQGDALDELHEQEQLPVGLAELVDADDVAMRQLGERARLAQEACLELGILAELPRQDLERHDAVQALLARAIDDAHTALPDELEDLEVGEVCPHGLGGRRRRDLGVVPTPLGEGGLEQALGIVGQIGHGMGLSGLLPPQDARPQRGYRPILYAGPARRQEAGVRRPALAE